ncbi:MAG: shikimate dehydrogenase [Hyphomicrobiaceae bacterium]|nr:shikimate dehydrogenase [Hyphomicrobiaceae bacterium]
MKRACVIGWPVQQSRSPLIHGHWLARYGIDGLYGKIAVAPGEAADFLRALAANGFAGCNVTVPLKELAFAAADAHEPSAVAVGAANTLWLEAGKLVAANTDTYGFMTHLAEAAPGLDLAGARVAVLGAGGAARAIVFGLQTAGADDIVVMNRTHDRARALADAFGPPVRALPWEHRAGCPAWADLIVNTTTIGMKGDGTLGLDFSSPKAGTIVADIVYVPLRTGLLHDAQAAGLTTVDGLGMLLHQAVPGFERWFGVRPEVTAELRRTIVCDIEGSAC